MRKLNMRTVRRLSFALLAASTVLALLACGEIKVSGGVSEETNTLAGVLVTSNGSQLGSVALFARSVQSDTVREFVDTTALNGRFALEVPKGLYALSAETGSQVYYEILNVADDAEIRAVTEVADTVTMQFAGSVEVVASLPGTGIEATSKNGRLDMALPHDVAVLVEPKDEVYESAFFRVREGSIAGPFPAETALDTLLDLPFAKNVEGTLTLPKKMKVAYEWNFENVEPASVPYVLYNAEKLYLYGEPVVENGAVHFANSRQFAVLETDGGAFDNAKVFSISFKVKFDSIPALESYRKNLLGKVGFGSEGDESAFSVALVKNECGQKGARIAFFVAGENDFASDCDNAVFSANEIGISEWIYVAASFDNGKLRIFENGALSSESEIDVKTLRASTESIYIGKENVSMNVASVTLGLSALGNADAYFNYYRQGGR